MFENIPFFAPVADSHAHYDDGRFDDCRDELLPALSDFGVELIINCAVDCHSSAEKCVDMSDRYGFCRTAVGVHPLNMDDNGPLDDGLLRRLLKKKGAVAVGEIGLDYHYEKESKERQLALFERQLGIANELSLPVIVHDREAHDDTLRLLKKHRPRGVVHCFSGSVEMAREVLKLGMYIGVGGVVTFKNARRLREVTEELPEDRILLETDAPYLAPEPMRGALCHSAMISFTAAEAARIRGTSPEKLLSAASRNAKELFNI